MPSAKQGKQSLKALPALDDSVLLRLEQYKQLCEDSRNYDQKLWLVPGAAYTASALFYGIVFNYAGYNYLIRAVLQSLNLLIFSGFLFQFVQDRAYQLEIQNAINDITKTMPGMVTVVQYAGTLKGDSKDRWYVRALRRHSASNFVFYIMFASVFAHLGVFITLAIELVINWSSIFK